ncbi:hypothetical protein Taro_036830 [Colocasia esculenta]|uniref:Protein kinase domain-containing protein n=1 Tax=Colocasia esculenta TaxID=4460 RepID=A0A843W2J4_COLES|nr:hypothetical protein [Colocasia esculenta]
MGGSRSKWVRGRCLGRGSTAAVYLAASSSHSDREEYFAVKSAELSHSTPLRREQKILSSLCSPHVVSCFGSDVTDEPDGRVLYNLFIEYVPGGSLAEEIKQQGGLDERAVRFYTRGILDGLAYLHGRGIVHCDVKGHNILVGEDDGTIKIADFGCARWVDDVCDGRVVVSGTPLYMAPEVARGEEQGPAADIWALGCTVIEMATGCPPWRDVADPVAAIHRIGFSTDVPDLPCNISDDAKDFLGRCLSRDPRKRWSARELLHHPFVKCCEEFAAVSIPDSKRTSPKSTLDQGFWESWQDEDDAGEEEDELVGRRLGTQKPPLQSIQGRLLQLVGGPALLPPVALATSEESSWITVRDSGSFQAQQATSSTGSCQVEEIVGGNRGDVDLACCSTDLGSVSATAEEVSPPNSSLSSCSANDDINHSCGALLQDGRNLSVDVHNCSYFSEHVRLSNIYDYGICVL